MEFDDKVESLMDGPTVDRNNLAQKVRLFHQEYRKWLWCCMHTKPDKKLMDLKAWNASDGHVILKPSRVAEDEDAIPRLRDHNNLIPGELYRFLTKGFIYFNPDKHKISLDGPVVPEEDMKDAQQTFGPLFMDCFWNSFLLNTLKLDQMIDYILDTADIEDVLSMSFIETTRIRDPSTDRITKSSKANYLFTNQIVSTFLWHCEVAFSSDPSIKNDSGLRRKVIFEELCDHDYELEDVFVAKFEEYLSVKRETFASAKSALENDFSSSTPARKPSRMKANPRVCAPACASLLSRNGRGVHLRSKSAHMENLRSDTCMCGMLTYCCICSSVVLARHRQKLSSSTAAPTKAAVTRKTVAAAMRTRKTTTAEGRAPSLPYRSIPLSSLLRVVLRLLR